jgi:hypothetical protein
MTANSVTIHIGYGYDVHSIIVPKLVYKKIQAGEAVMLQGQGFMTDEGLTQDFWLFNHERHRTVYVYCDDTRNVYDGDDYWVQEQQLASDSVSDRDSAPASEARHNGYRGSNAGR